MHTLRSWAGVERGQRGIRWNTAMRFLRALDADLYQLADAIDAQHDRSVAGWEPTWPKSLRRWEPCRSTPESISGRPPAREYL
jgi:hypothetical protein